LRSAKQGKHIASLRFEPAGRVRAREDAGAGIEADVADPELRLARFQSFSKAPAQDISTRA